jgi:nucleoside phosphorylase
MGCDLASAAPRRDVLVVTGLAFEADIARHCTGVEVLFGVGQAVLRGDLHTALADAAQRAAGIVSFGTAGALDPALKPGDWLLAETVWDGSHDEPRGKQADEADEDDEDDEAHEVGELHDARRDPNTPPYQRYPRYPRYAGDRRWLATLAECLPGAHRVDLFAATDPVASAADKARLFAESGAAAVDMESGHLARLAKQYRIPFVACRVVIDRATHSLPDAALAGMRDDGQTAITPVLRSLARDPRQLGSLLRLAGDAWQARRAMQALGKRLPPRFGLANDAETSSPPHRG